MQAEDPKQEERLRGISTEKEVRLQVEHDETLPGINNLEAMHTLAILFPLIGMLLPVGYSCSVYLDTNMTYIDQGKYIYTPSVDFHEPFAACSNAAFFTAGIGLYLLP